MTNQIQNLISLAIKKGYVPEKKDNFDVSMEMTNAKIDGYNQAIDSYNLEKIIELAYEKVGEILKEKEQEANEILKNSPKNFSAMGAIACIIDIKKSLLTNLSPNKEE